MGNTAFIDVLLNDYHPYNGELTVGNVSNPSVGTSQLLQPDNKILYTPPNLFTGRANFTYYACDSDNECMPALVMVTVTPLAYDDTRTVEEGGAVFAEVLENDIGSDLILTAVAEPNNGMCIVLGDQVMYTPYYGFKGMDQCVYTACTGQTDVCDTARLIVLVLESPTYEPSAAPSSSPTEAWYYPDFTYESNVCLNDYLEPEYMLQHQRDNYLYRSKEECCHSHFWWRITQVSVLDYACLFCALL